MSKQELNLYSKVCKAYDNAIIMFKTGSKQEYENAVNKLNKLRQNFYDITGNATPALEINI